MSGDVNRDETKRTRRSTTRRTRRRALGHGESAIAQSDTQKERVIEKGEGDEEEGSVCRRKQWSTNGDERCQQEKKEGRERGGDL